MVSKTKDSAHKLPNPWLLTLIIFEMLIKYTLHKFIKCFVGQFHCKSSTICLHVANVCDWNIDCILGDDEWGCDLTDCLIECTCFNYAMSCYNIPSANFSGHFMFYKI